MFRRTRAIATAAAVALVLAAGGCADESEQDSQEALADLQERVLADMTEAVEAVGGSGLEVVEAAGVAEYCQMPPDPGATYYAGARVTEDGDPDAQVAAIREALVDAGWTIESEEPPPDPQASLTRDDLRASVSVSRRQDEPGVVFSVKGPCLSVNDDYRLPEDDLRTEITP